MANLQKLVVIPVLVVAFIAVVGFVYLSSRESQEGKYLKWYKDIIRLTNKKLQITLI